MAKPGKETELMRAAILLALMESPGLQQTPDELELRVRELLNLGEEEIRQRGRALRAQRNN